MTLKLIHTFNDKIDLYYEDVPLFSYVYVSRVPAIESPRPYFHPVRTLAGDVVTNFRPNDHRWHQGFSMTMPYISGDNFWGGKSFVRGQGYVQLDNNGQQRHVNWDYLTCTDDEADLRQRIVWVSYAGETWIEEERRIVVGEVNPEMSCWTLEVHLSLHNVRGEALEFGSPATEGRPDGVGYGGWFWRGARDLTGGLVMISDGSETSKSDMVVMGHSGPWLAFVGAHDGVDRSSTLVFIDQPQNPRYPTQWFARTESNVCASFALTYADTYTLEADETLNLSYTMVIASGAWNRQQIEAFLKQR
ncbi:MAG: PmoA family protein [Anaerolineae bacterium]|nr:PmoA family protein [Anaerolineae bacterium]